MEKLAIDFETRSEIDIKKAGAFRYAEDASTDVLCLAYETPWGDIELWKKGDPKPELLFSFIKEGYFFEAHNAQFEWAIWNLYWV